MRKSVQWMVGTAGALAGTAALAAGGYGYGPPGDYDRVYLGFSAGELIYDEQGLDTMNPKVAFFKIGEQFNPYMAVEARIGTGIANWSWDGYNVKVNALYSGYLKGIIPLSPQFSLYGLAGGTGADLHRNYPDYNSTDGSFSYGAGAEFRLGPSAFLDAEYTRALTGTNVGYDYTADLFTVGVSWRL